MQLMAEQFNQVHQILAALSALWQVSGAFRTLNVEFLDDTGSIQAPPSPCLHTTFLAAKEMDTIELRRLLRPLCGLGKNVVVHVSALPLAVAAYITTREVLFVPAEHPFKTYASLAGRVDAAISKVRDAGLCCTRVDSTDNKPCGIRSLEKKLLIVREKIIICDIGSRHAEEELEMDFDALSGFLESRKVRDLVEMADGLLLCLGESFDDCE
ncbi:uncharacterized protein RCC_11381 [Ramularia collo-cygni]|uniref:Uncharacterized protein n=1 Tax=Ramularia collo-cygni TaxID=112498 RepID=A0A2D3V5X8_9PEZI|nr:uncharacterized protein RCC_11381 [Ramularia collo-cygni]CZT25712.1 uncharacterized protein RCC_11381 [Ramularia collo-cygni]